MQYLKSESGVSTHLVRNLEKVDAHLRESGTTFMVDDHLMRADCYLLSTLQHIRVAGKVCTPSLSPLHCHPFIVAPSLSPLCITAPSLSPLCITASSLSPLCITAPSLSPLRITAPSLSPIHCRPFIVAPSLSPIHCRPFA